MAIAPPLTPARGRAQYQDYVLDGTATGRSDPLCRMAGAAVGSLGVATLLAAYDDDFKSNRRLHRVNAGHYALLAGLGTNKLVSGGGGLQARARALPHADPGPIITMHP